MSAVTPGEELTEAFRPLEQALWISETRASVEWMNTILSPTFSEHGQSGRTFNREEILGLPIPEHIDVVLPFPDFAARAIEPAVVLVTYTSIVRGNAANRSSVWRHDGTRWLLEFHQGTPATVTATGLALDATQLRAQTFNTSMRGYDGARRCIPRRASDSSRGWRTCDRGRFLAPTLRGGYARLCVR